MDIFLKTFISKSLWQVKLNSDRYYSTRESEFPMQLECTENCEAPGSVQMHSSGKVGKHNLGAFKAS